MKNKLNAVVWVLVVLILFFMLVVISKTSYIFFESATVVNGQVVELNVPASVKSSDEGQIVRYNWTSQETVTVPIFALDGTRIYTTKPSEVVVKVGEDVEQFEAEAGLYVEKTADSFIFRGANQGSQNNTTIPYTDGANNNAVISFGPNESVVLTGVEIDIDGVITQYPPFTYINVDETAQTIQIIYPEDGMLVVENTSYVERYDLNYSNVPTE